MMTDIGERSGSGQVLFMTREGALLVLWFALLANYLSVVISTIMFLLTQNLVGMHVFLSCLLKP